jgi:hypothetical protein
MDWRNSTNEDALAAWDRGEPVWSCDMGGMGPGYEQCIQLMGFEMLRAMVASPPENWEVLTGPDGRDAWSEYKDKIEAVPGVKAAIESLQPSGAQFGAAMNIASVFARNGYSGGVEKIPEERRIQVSKNFPTLDGKTIAA